MSSARLSGSRLACLLVLWALAFLPGLGSSSRLTYHEALVGQGAREILATGEWSSPTIGGLPWLEKPPLPWWLVAVLGHYTGAITEAVARFPSALAAATLVVGVALLATRHYGADIGLLAAALQTTTVWTVTRGRLAEADILLACLITWAMVAFDRFCYAGTAAGGNADPDPGTKRWKAARWAFFALLGLSALVKGVGFGAVLIILVVSIVLLWQRDAKSLGRCSFPAGWALAGVLALAWPLVVVMRNGAGAIALWTSHFTDRLVVHHGAGPFASEPWWEYLPSIAGQALPWSPLALVGACRSLRCALCRCAHVGSVCNSAPAVPGVADRLLWAWSAGPLILLSLAAVRNAHYAVCAQVPWSIWAALELARVGKILHQRGWDERRLCHIAQVGFATLALGYGVGFWLLGPRFDQRGVEWAFYESASRKVPANVPLALLYDDWDRSMYASPFGSLPHDVAVRLYYLGRRACWHASTVSLSAHVCAHSVIECSPGWRQDCGQRVGTPVSSVSTSSADLRAAGVAPALAVIGRDRDLPALARLGHVEILARGPALRRDRTYTLFRITLREPVLNLPIPAAMTAAAAGATPR